MKLDTGLKAPGSILISLRGLSIVDVASVLPVVSDVFNVKIILVRGGDGP